MKPKRPALRYHGGKWRLAPWIIAHFPAHRIYVEPFGGAASVLLRKPRSEAEVYNDIDGEVVNVFRVLRDQAAASALGAAIRLTPYARAEYELADEPSADPVEQARRTLVKAWLGFGSGHLQAGSGGLRVSLTKRRHTPHEWARFADAIPAITERFAGVLVENRPAAAVIEKHDAPDAMLFIDPPYVGETRGSRHTYRHEMNDADHIVLAEQARGCRGMVVVAGYASPLYADLYPRWTMVRRESRDALSQARTEVLWLNDACVAALEPLEVRWGEELAAPIDAARRSDLQMGAA